MFISFKPWRQFEAEYDRANVRDFFKTVAREGKKAFQAGLDGSHSGRIRQAKNKSNNQASVNRHRAEYPANDTGDLRASISGRSTSSMAVISSGMEYSLYLRTGTPMIHTGVQIMKRRRMSDDALDAGIEAARAAGSLRDWVRWKRT